MEKSEESFIEQIRGQTNAKIHYLLKVQVLVDMLIQKDYEIKNYEQQIKDLKLDKQVLEETLYGGNVSE